MDKLIEAIKEHKKKVIAVVLAAIVGILSVVTDIGVDLSETVQERLENVQ